MVKPAERRAQTALGATLALLALTVCGCGNSSSSEQSSIEEARRQGAAAAHHADQIRQLQKEVATLQAERSAEPQSSSSASPSDVTPSSPDSRIPQSGTYDGEARQRGAPARVNKNYPMQMSFSSSGSRVIYPTLGCEGVLQPLGFQGESRVYEEKVTSGHCDSGGTWLVHVDGPPTIEAAWSLPSASYTVTAVLVAE